MDNLIKDAKALVAPDKSIGPSLAAKKANIDQYVNSNKAKANTTPPAAQSTSTVDKVNPKAKYGDKAGEKSINVEDMVKPLGTFHKGTDYVPKTGAYVLEKGEKVVPKEQNMSMDHLKDALGGNDKNAKPKKELKEIRTRKAKDGKIIHEHHFTHPEHYDKEEHVSANQDELVDHMLEHMGTPNDGEQEANEGQSGIDDETQEQGAQ